MNPLNSLIKKFSYAFQGLGDCFKQSTFRIMTVIAALAIILGIPLNLSLYEWMTIIACITICLGVEAINTALEKACNLFSQGWLVSEVRLIKDTAATSVMIFSTGSAIIGLIIYIPRIIEKIG